MPTIKTKHRFRDRQGLSELLIGAWATREYQNAIGASQQ
jgi:hypothetical protein